MTLGVTSLSIARLRALTALRSDLLQSIAELKVQGKDSPTMRQSLRDIDTEAVNLRRTIMAARASQ